jgi:hypothetical protein
MSGSHDKLLKKQDFYKFVILHHSTHTLSSTSGIVKPCTFFDHLFAHVPNKKKKKIPHRAWEVLKNEKL